MSNAVRRAGFCPPLEIDLSGGEEAGWLDLKSHVMQAYEDSLAPGARSAFFGGPPAARLAPKQSRQVH